MDSRLKDLTGLGFGLLEVISRAASYPNGNSCWLCKCDCGNSVVVASVSLRAKKYPKKSCGCLDARHSEHRSAAYKKAEDLTGQRFGRLLVVSRADSYTNKVSRWLCKCDCGNSAIVPITHLKSTTKPTKSCGCLRLTTSKTHGHSSHPFVNGVRIKEKCTRTYSSWRGMKSRCLNTNSPHYRDYGGRGIVMCERWNSFEAFLSDMGERPEEMSLDRIDVNGNYEPGNCRWATQSVQVKNQRPRTVIENFSNEVFLKEFNRRFPEPEYGISGC